MMKRMSPIPGYLVKGKLMPRLFFMFCTICSFTFPTQDEIEEYNIKAAFIYKFTNYIDWDSLIPGDEFIIGIIGPSPVKGELAEIARTKTIKDKKIVVRQFNKLDEI